MNDVVNFKPKKTGLVRMEDGELVDFDAWLVARGYDRATINALFAKYVTNEEEAPDVAKARKRLEAQPAILALLWESAAKAQADLSTALEEERNLEAQVIIAKAIYLDALARRAQAIVNGSDPTEKPKRQRKSRRS
jgi:hypothetical protein